MSDVSDRPITFPPRRQDAREALLQAGCELMIERDEIDVPLSDIAARANVNSALIKYYFGNKNGLLLALLERDVGDAVRNLELLLSGSETATRKLSAHLWGLMRVYNKRPYINRLIRMTFSRLDDETCHEVSRRVVLPICNFYRVVLDEGYESGEFRRVDPMLFYLTTVGACDQFFSSRYLLPYLGLQEPAGDLQRAYTDHLVTMILKGVARP